MYVCNPNIDVRSMDRSITYDKNSNLLILALKGLFAYTWRQLVSTLHKHYATSKFLASHIISYLG